MTNPDIVREKLNNALRVNPPAIAAVMIGNSGNGYVEIAVDDNGGILLGESAVGADHGFVLGTDLADNTWTLLVDAMGPARVFTVWNTTDQPVEITMATGLPSSILFHIPEGSDFTWDLRANNFTSAGVDIYVRRAFGVSPSTGRVYAMLARDAVPVASEDLLTETGESLLTETGENLQTEPTFT